MDDFGYQEMKISQNREFLASEFKKHLEALYNIALAKKDLNFKDFCKELKNAISALEGA